MRNFIKIMHEICEEEGIELREYSGDWVLSLHRNGKCSYIIGNKFDLNSASVDAICCDKTAASDVMQQYGIPHVEHFLFRLDGDSWSEIGGLLSKYGALVCKPNNGCGGKQVFKAITMQELVAAVNDIKESGSHVAICPYYDVKNEYRVIILNGVVKLVYKKERQYSVEDGKLMYIDWRHNLCKGAKAEVIDFTDVDAQIYEIVHDVVRKMNVKFASIDVIECADGYRVIEINSGVTMAYFSKQDDRFYNIAKEIYREAVLSMMSQ